MIDLEKAVEVAMKIAKLAGVRIPRVVSVSRKENTWEIVVEGYFSERRFLVEINEEGKCILWKELEFD